jgi:hypothetical protein
MPITHMKQDRKFVFIEYSDRPNVDIQPFHGKAVALDISDKHAPFPSLLIIHEMRVRGFNPFHNASPDLPDVITWQDWITTSGVLDGSQSHFHRHSRGLRGSGSAGPLQIPSITPINTSGGSGSGTRRLELTEDIIAEILAVTHAMPSWKECEMGEEETRWVGTAEENTKKYLSISQGA